MKNIIYLILINTQKEANKKPNKFLTQPQTIKTQRKISINHMPLSQTIIRLSLAGRRVHNLPYTYTSHTTNIFITSHPLRLLFSILYF